jgi:hypothetical protein
LDNTEKGGLQKKFEHFLNFISRITDHRYFYFAVMARLIKLAVCKETESHFLPRLLWRFGPFLGNGFPVAGVSR